MEVLTTMCGSCDHSMQKSFWQPCMVITLRITITSVLILIWKPLATICSCKESTNKNNKHHHKDHQKVHVCTLDLEVIIDFLVTCTWGHGSRIDWVTWNSNKYMARIKTACTSKEQNMLTVHACAPNSSHKKLSNDKPESGEGLVTGSSWHTSDMSGSKVLKWYCIHFFSPYMLPWMNLSPSFSVTTEGVTISSVTVIINYILGKP